MRSIAFIVCILGFASTAAEAAPPWHDGTTEPQRNEAFSLFSEGRRLLFESFFPRAVDRLKASLAVWDHPTTHLALAKALLNLDQSVDAIVHLWASLRYSGHPLDLEQVEQVERASAVLLETELARVVVMTELDQPVLVAGKLVLEGRGTWEGLVRAGDVAIASSAGKPLTLKVAPGTSVHVDVKRGKLELSQQHKIEPSEVASLQNALLGFVVVSPSASERAAWPRRAPTQSTWVDPGDALPAPGRALCAKPATRELATVCELYAADYKALVQLMRREEAAKLTAIRRQEELTRGALPDRLD